ncbi:MAG TPA: hypothetical protein VF190_03490 [Rhodothermales bacterium]
MYSAPNPEYIKRHCDMAIDTLFSDYPAHAQLWVYPTAQTLSDEQEAGLLAALQPFLSTWTTHGSPVTASAAVVGRRFLLIAGYIPDGGVSGCGIDASTRAIEQAARSQGIEWASTLEVFYRDASGTVASVGRRDFRQLAENGTVSDQVAVFDPSITTVGALRDGSFERPASESWHGRYFERTAA